MPINNETLIAIPLDLLEQEELRTFLVKLIVQLDIALGYRNGSTDREIAGQAILREEFEEFVESLNLGTVDPLTPYSQTISNPPTQAEVQTLSDNLTLTISKVNEILGATGLQDNGPSIRIF